MWDHIRSRAIRWRGRRAGVSPAGTSPRHLEQASGLTRHRRRPGQPHAPPRHPQASHAQRQTPAHNGRPTQAPRSVARGVAPLSARERPTRAARRKARPWEPEETGTAMGHAATSPKAGRPVSLTGRAEESELLVLSEGCPLPVPALAASARAPKPESGASGGVADARCAVQSPESTRSRVAKHRSSRKVAQGDENVRVARVGRADREMRLSACVASGCGSSSSLPRGSRAPSTRRLLGCVASGQFVWRCVAIVSALDFAFGFAFSVARAHNCDPRAFAGRAVSLVPAILRVRPEPIFGNG